jgi:hypothetical protein
MPRRVEVLTFVACREIRHIPGTHPPEYALLAPALNWWAETYPAQIWMGIYVEFTGAGGAYTARIEVFDGDGRPVGCLAEGGPFVSDDPVRVHCITLERAGLAVPRPGMYDLVLFMNGEEVARRQLWVRPRN